MSALAEVDDLDRGNDLTITIEPRNGAYEVRVRLSPLPGEKEPPTICESRLASSLRDMNDRCRADLELIRKRFGGTLGGTERAAVGALTEFHRTGRAYWTALLGRKDAQLLWELEKRLSRRPGPLNVEVKTPADLTVPGEILPLARRLPGHDLGRLARTLPAFRGVVRTTFLEPGGGETAGLLDQDRVLYGGPSPPLLFLWHAGAPASGLTRKVLEAHSAARRVSLDGPYPAARAYPAKEGLAGLLVEPSRHQMRAVNGVFPAQIVHIHSHGRVGQKSVAAFGELEFAYREERSLPWPRLRRVVVDNADLNDAYDEARAELHERRRGPLAFFSACGAVAAPGQVGAFVDRFFDFGYRAVIGPTVDIPGSVAHEMWKEFLQSLLVSRRPVGRALYEARMKLLARKNPLGAFLMLYGEPNLSLASGTRT